MTDVKAVPAPKGLPPAGATLWRSLARQWADDGLTPDARERRLLEDACHEAAMLTVLQAALEEAQDAGQLIVKGSMGQPVVNSLVNECRRSRAQVAALLLKLGLEDPGVAGPVAPPTGQMSASEAGRRGGFAKHYGRTDGLG